MNGRVLRAQEGCVYTDGVHFGSVVYLSAADDGAGWYQVSEQDVGPQAEATQDDYRQALGEFGVMI